ncbi:MAG: helix-turn-helix domain-containing protein [Actinomycetota bacterium]|nr:helix-turn-helix domain-containing protein [Actinomycetota bacterium]
MTRRAGSSGGSDVIGLQQAADRLGVHYMTVYRYVRTGRLPATKVGGSGGWSSPISTGSLPRTTDGPRNSTG